MKLLIVAAALTCLALSASDAKAWMHHGYGWGGGYNHHYGWGHHGWGWGHYGWHHGGWGGACRLRCNPFGNCWRVCW